MNALEHLRRGPGKRGRKAKAISGRMPKVWFSAAEMEDWMRGEFPQLMATPGQASDMRVRLIDLTNYNKLERRGVGHDAKYRNAGAVESAPEMSISVPRDADVVRA